MRIYYHVCCLPVYRISSTKELLRLFLIHMHPVHQFPVIQIQIPVYGIFSLIKFMVFPVRSNDSSLWKFLLKLVKIL